MTMHNGGEKPNAIVDRAAAPCPDDVGTQIRDMCLNQRFSLSELPVVEMYVTWERVRRGDHDGAIPVMRQSVEDLFIRGQFMYCVAVTAFLVKTLLDRATESDLAEAESAIDRLAAVASDGWVARDIVLLRLRALLAKAYGDETGYRDYRDRYRAMATSLGFEGHMKWAEAMG